MGFSVSYQPSRRLDRQRKIKEQLTLLTFFSPFGFSSRVLYDHIRTYLFFYFNLVDIIIVVDVSSLENIWPKLLAKAVLILSSLRVRCPFGEADHVLRLAPSSRALCFRSCFRCSAYTPHHALLYHLPSHNHPLLPNHALSPPPQPQPPPSPQPRCLLRCDGSIRTETLSASHAPEPHLSGHVFGHVLLINLFFPRISSWTVSLNARVRVRVCLCVCFLLIL